VAKHFTHLRTLRTSALLMAAAGLCTGFVPGCGVFQGESTSSASSSGKAASAESAPPVETAGDVALAPGVTEPAPGVSMAASAGTDAWINPQARLEPGSDNAPATFNLRQVTFAQEGADFDPAVSRDGTRIVFASTQHRPTADLFVKTISGRTITQLTDDPAEDGTPDISPDGTRVAFASNRDGNWDIFVMPVTGGKAVQVTSDESDELHPSWSSDGQKLVFSRMGPTSGRWEMWVTDANQASGATFIGYGLFPRFCPTGGTGADGADRIVYQLGRERGQRSFAIWTTDYIDGQASNPTLIASSTDAALINPTWSPDGDYIVYSSVPSAGNWGSSNAGGPPAAELWLASVTADATVRLTNSDLRAIRPVWGPSNRLYFVSSRNATENIWSLDLSQSLASLGAPTGTFAAAPNARKNGPVGNGTRSTQQATKPASRPAPVHPDEQGAEEADSTTSTADAGDDQ
jgi:TolB protein